MKRGVITSVICSLVGMHTVSAIMAAEKERPRLVVGIMVDQLRTDYVEYLQDLFGEKGFRKLMKDGVFIKDVDFKVGDLDAVSGTAMVYTGNYPRYNGITSSKVYSPETKGMVPVLNDPSTIGNFTTEKYSPANIRLSTISDEIAIDGNGEGKIYSIAPDAQQAIVMAGHAGNSAYWINDNNGYWASTTYYIDSPKWITQRNYQNSINSRLDTMVWKPVRDSASYPGFSAKKKDGFKHIFPKSDRSVYRMYSSSPLVNEEITDVAISYLENLSLGKDDGAIDMLNLAYTAAPYKFDNDGDLRPELEDSYVRLDGQLAKLFDAIDRYVGLDNTLIYLSSTGYFDEAVLDDGKYKIPTGTFSVKRALSLLNSYLSAQFGNGSYVDTYSDNHIYLDKQEIEEKNLNLNTVAQLSRDFLVRMSGVNDAFTMGDVLGSTLPHMEGRRLGIDPKTGGDIILEFNAGWNVVDDTRYPNEVEAARSSMELSPAFIMWPNLLPEVIEYTVDATAIAPTITKALRIRAPNGVASKPLALKKR